MLSLSLTQPTIAGEFESLEAIPEQYTVDGLEKITDPARRIWFDPSRITWESFTKKVQSELRWRQHKCSPAVINIIVCIYCLHPNRHSEPIETFNHVLDCIGGCELTQFFVLPNFPPPTFERFSFGRFTLGTIDIDRLESRSRKAGSDFYIRYRDALAHKMTFERNRAAASILDLEILLAEIRQIDDHASTDWNRFIEAYFLALSDEYWDDFWADFLESQSLFVAAGAPLLTTRLFQLLLYVSRISIFLKDTWGHVSPGRVGAVSFDFARADKKFPAIQRDLRDRFGFIKFTNDEVHKTLHVFSSFMARAEHHFVEGNSDEAFLLYIIALDLVFGDEASIAKTVANRVGALVHKQLSMEFRDVTSWVSKAYAARSKYVHEGRHVESEEMVKQAKTIAREVLYCLLRIQHTRGDRITTIQHWLKQVDFIVAGYEAGRVPSADDLAQIGAV